MIMEIHSVYGVLKCTPMTLQAIEKSIPEASIDANKDSEASQNIADSCEAQAEPVGAPSTETA